MRRSISCLALAFAPFLFFACSESSTDAPSGLPSTVRNLSVLHTLDCNESYVDSIVKVEDGHLKFVCDGEKWVSLQKGKNSESSSSSEGDDNSSGRDYSSSTEDYYSSARAPSSSSTVEEYSSGETEHYSSDAPHSSSSISSSSISAYTRYPDSTEKPPFESHLVTWDETFYGSEFDEATGILTDLRDNNQYRTMTVGSCTWTIDNLRFSDSTMAPSLIGRTYCDSTGKECKYTWGAAMDSVNTGCGYDNVCDGNRHWKGICPHGWHIPTKKDLDNLFLALPAGLAYETLLNEYDFWESLPDTSQYVISGIWFAESYNGSKQAKLLSHRRANGSEHESYSYWLSDTYKSARINVRCVKD